MANKIIGRQKYKVEICSLDGAEVRSSSGHPFPVDSKLDAVARIDYLLICSSDDVEQIALPTALTSRMHALASHGTTLGALCTGTFILAKLGFLEDCSCTIHWEYAAMFRESFPFIDLKQDVFVVDRNRFTCAGGTAALDLMLAILGRSSSADIVNAVADMAIHHDQRNAETDQRLTIGRRLGISQPAVLHAIALMEQNLETPLSCPEIARQTGLGVRQLQRQFESSLGASPISYYVDLRLKAARDLVLKTSMPISKIAYACGFANPSNFGKQYRDRFLASPQGDRKENRGNTSIV